MKSKIVINNFNWKKHIGSDGRFSEPVIFKDYIYFDGALKSFDNVSFTPNCSVYGLNDIACVKGVKLNKGCRLSGLVSLESLDGIELAENCELAWLERVTSLKGVVVPDGCRLWGLKTLMSVEGLTVGKDCQLHTLTRLLSLSGAVLGEGICLYDLNSLASLDELISWPKNTVLGGLREEVRLSDGDWRSKWINVL